MPHKEVQNINKKDMHNSSMLRMKWFVENHVSKINKSKIKILDVGSYDVNGSYKELFIGDQYEYYGLDMEEGPNVDIVIENPYDWSTLGVETYDVVISGQAFEHIEFFWLTMANMATVLKKDGLICIVVPCGSEEHRYPVDCYRFFTDGMIALARYVNFEILHSHTNRAPKPTEKEWFSVKDADSFLIAKKNYEGPVKYVDISSYKCIPIDHSSVYEGFVKYKRNLIAKIARQIYKWGEK